MIRPLTDQDFKTTVIEAKQTALVVCYTPESGLCKLVVELVEKFALKYKAALNVYMMHVYDSKDTFIEYKVQALPTLLYFREGVLVNRMVEVKLSANLDKQIEEIIAGKFLLTNPLFTEVTDDNFAAEVKGFKGVVALNFWVSGVDACWSMEKDLTDLTKQYQNLFKVCIVNWRESKDLVGRFRVTEIPTMVFLVNQLEEDRVTGLKNRRTIENIFRHVAFKFNLL